jgi:PAS domain S-box-containing protein
MDFQTDKKMETIILKEEQYHAVFEHSPDAMIVVDDEGIIILLNSQTEVLFGYKREELISYPIEKLVPQKYRSSHVRHIIKYENDPHSRPMGSGSELYGLRKDGTEFSVEISLSPLKLEQGNLVLAAIRDVTERTKMVKALQTFNLTLEKQVEERTLALREANIDLEESNKELESFAYSISHDLKAPLRAINGFSKILSEEYHDERESEDMELFKLIQKNATEMGVLIDRLLEFSRLNQQTVNQEQIDMKSLVEDIWQKLLLSYPEIQINFISENIPKAQGDTVLLAQVWTNLLENAIKFTRDCSNPKVIVGYQKGKENQGGSYFVKDNGIGFDQKYVETVFGVFQRAHKAEEHEGTGIGLAIVERIIKRHGGRIRAESEIGKGATFYFTLEKPVD